MKEQDRIYRGLELRVEPKDEPNLYKELRPKTAPEVLVFWANKLKEWRNK